MKKLITFLMLSTFYYGSAQVIVEQEDVFTKKKTIEYRVAQKKEWRGSDNVFKGSNIVGRFYLTNNISNGDIYLNMFINYISGCIAPEKSKIIFLLDNDETVELINIAEINCGKINDPIFKINLEQIKTLSDNLISGVRFYYTDGYVDLNLRDGKNELIKNTFKLYLNNN